MELILVKKRVRKSELDKFYTDEGIAAVCGYIFFLYASPPVVEPSAGAGVFAPYVDVMLDLEPEGPNIIQQDFLEFDTTQYENYLGNPPFGVNASLAKGFFNHAAKGKGVIGFILPKTFRKVSVQNSLDLNFHLIEDVEVPENSFTLEGEVYDVPCTFQVWEYRNEKREKINFPIVHEDFSFVKPLKVGDPPKVVPPLEYDFSIRRVGGLAGKVLSKEKTGAPPSHYFLRATPEVRERLEKLYDEFQDVAKNTAGNPSLGKGELISIYSRKNST